MSNPHVYNLLNDLVRLSAGMQDIDRSHLQEWRRVGFDARAILRLVLAESPTLAEVNARRGYPQGAAR